MKHLASHHWTQCYHCIQSPPRQHLHFQLQRLTSCTMFLPSSSSNDDLYTNVFTMSFTLSTTALISLVFKMPSTVIKLCTLCAMHPSRSTLAKLQALTILDPLSVT